MDRDNTYRESDREILQSMCISDSLGELEKAF